MKLKCDIRCGCDTKRIYGRMGDEIKVISDRGHVLIVEGKEGTYGVVNLNTPFTKWENGDYPFTSELGADVQAAIYEVEQYLFEGKKAPTNQLEMEFPEPGGEGAEE